MTNEQLCLCLLLSLREKKDEIDVRRMRLHGVLESLIDSHAPEIERITGSVPFGHTLFGTYIDLEIAERELMYSGAVSWTLWPCRFIWEYSAETARKARTLYTESLGEEARASLDRVCAEFVAREASRS